ncbi:hypothetical protein EXIGLDRAFT_776222 [Exidia glandulosa HHB12029]|uniref:Uncharacterized protein n=1 Tax=Exidia glandulosa HHB12029 TaxID=1314781 RepID=A0A165DK87_EXIGL|nr:hypothetical protein EXIGLDRAFT_776222 [Exidia glandulosa HHB12029]
MNQHNRNSQGPPPYPPPYPQHSQQPPWHSGMPQGHGAQPQYDFFPQHQDAPQPAQTTPMNLRRSPRGHASPQVYPAQHRPTIQPIHYFGSVPASPLARTDMYTTYAPQPVDTSNLLVSTPQPASSVCPPPIHEPPQDLADSDVELVPPSDPKRDKSAKNSTKKPAKAAKSKSESPTPASTTTNSKMKTEAKKKAEVKAKGKGTKTKGGAGSKSGPLNRRSAGMSDEEIDMLDADEAEDADLADDDPPSGNEEETRRWDAKDQVKAVEYATSDAVYPSLRVNGGKVHRDVLFFLFVLPRSDVFQIGQKVLNGRKTQAQVRNFFTIAWSKYAAVKRRQLRRQKHTGGGDGDADNPLAPTFEGSDNGGRGKFSDAVLDAFENGPLFPLIDRVAKNDANIVRKREWSSGASVSDAEDERKPKRAKTEDDDDSKDAISALVTSMKEKGKAEAEIGRANLELQRMREEREQRLAEKQDKREEAREARAEAQERRTDAEFFLRAKDTKLALLERIANLVASGGDADVIAQAKKLLADM